jgi:hypothetical protein
VPLLDQALPSKLHEWERESPQRAPVSPEASTSGGVTWGVMRLHRVLDSALSGGITGSILNTWRRSSLPCLLLQIRLSSMVFSFRWYTWYSHGDGVWISLLYHWTGTLQRDGCPTPQIYLSKIFYPLPAINTINCFRACRTFCA